MENLKTVPQALINKVRYSPLTSGLSFEKYGEYSDIMKYSDDVITEMIHGIYKHSKTLLVDDDYFINLKYVSEIICTLEGASFYKPLNEEGLTSYSTRIDNIRTFYVKKYVLLTSIEFNEKTEHDITRFLCKVGALGKGRNSHRNLYSVSNDYKTVMLFKQGHFSKDLFHPIKTFVNRLFFQDDYSITNFRVDSKLQINF